MSQFHNYVFKIKIQFSNVTQDLFHFIVRVFINNSVINNLVFRENALNFEL